MLDSRFWEKYFEVYDVLNELKPYQDLLISIRDNLKIKEGDLVLDAGAGTGNLAMLLTDAGAKVLAFDSSEAGLAIYKRKNENALIKVGDILDSLPFPDEHFDKICSNNVLYTIPRNKREPIAREFYRVLKPGGRIVISNVVEGFSPSKIYLEHLKWEFSRNSLLTVVRIVRFVIPTIKILYYNSLINKENEAGSYDFFKHGEQKELLLGCGFHNISQDQIVYAKQASLNVGLK